MNILITGANGQLGSEIKRIAPDYKKWNFIYRDLPELDITNLDQIKNIIQNENINAIVNCAAYTAVDPAESNKDLAYAVNVEGAKNLAIAASDYNAKLIHISTDFVFDGKYHLPYVETDQANPVSIYGITKLEGEYVVLETLPSSIIIRTAWLYSFYGNNFVKTMQRLGDERDELNVVFDQVGTPTWAADLALTILIILKQLGKGQTKKGIYHFSNEGVASWYDFAIQIMELSQIECKVFPIETKEYPTPAPRPSYSVLNKRKIKSDFGISIPHWKESLKKCVQELEKMK